MGGNFETNLQMLVLRVGGGPDLGQPTPCQSILYQFRVWSRKGGGGECFIVRHRQPTPHQSKVILIGGLMPKGRGNPSLGHHFSDLFTFSVILFGLFVFQTFS